jgi:hypothetical protein
MRTLTFAIVIFSICYGALGREASTSETKISDLHWIAGDWMSVESGTITEERWLEPRAGIMIGMNRMVFPNGKSTFEFLRIAETEKGVVYYASPGGKPPTPFALKQSEKSKAIFENTENDFPQRIIYERTGDTMVALIEGEVQGKTESMTWTWRLSAPKAR